MNILITPLPLFNSKMEVDSYYLDCQKGNKIIESSKLAMALDGCFRSPFLELINKVSLEALTFGKPVFVKITNILLSLNLEQQCVEPAEKIIFVLEDHIPVTEQTLAQVARLKGYGYRFAFRFTSQIQKYHDMVNLCDYLIFNTIDEMIEKKLEVLRKIYRKMKFVALNVNSNKEYREMVRYQMDLMGGRFVTTPVSKDSKTMEPLKANYIRLMKLVNEADFELADFTKFVSQDPALALAFLRMVNSSKFALKNEIKTIQHAAAMLGQNELRKWISSAVAMILSKDKPSEITRISLIRAKFAENLASKFGLEKESETVFLMGLFSIIDIVLGISLEEALNQIGVSKEVKEALIQHKGSYNPVYEFILQYETADWQSISRTLILNDLEVKEIAELYFDTIHWYSDLIHWQPEEGE